MNTKNARKSSRKLKSLRGENWRGKISEKISRTENSNKNGDYAMKQIYIWINLNYRNPVTSMNQLQEKIITPHIILSEAFHITKFHNVLCVLTFSLISFTVHYSKSINVIPPIKKFSANYQGSRKQAFRKQFKV